ncbi:DUF2790 domain-containing protein [Pseudomonas sp. D6002]|uniref:DUF2790 domain-containing protein n=1 Tax=unclassified Pseudomonas TaxID=196821 RepID=UPI0015A0D187|nr:MULTISPECIES: DUF2790 domain-containing protein [unclassified Pseudomonas]NVZ94450.1 DUF2790 domain-containing protein [Pseudomonas sp. B6001]NWB16585.1 DUF2790 domain-containing protein [Pseudomonas sp. D6002]NWB75825.1 DUF2790 domain-containing protein [Pseudomonas sp. G5001]
MKLRTLMLGAALALTTVTGMAQADTAPVITPYHYGEKMDVQKVLAMHEPDTNVCKVINADIKFVDSQGKVQDVGYRKMSEACDFQN